jgi:hypothetical protein
MTVSSRTKVAREEALMKFDGEIMEILAAYDLTGSLRAAAELTGCSHHTVARHVAARDAGQPIAEPAYRGRVTDAFLPTRNSWPSVMRVRSARPAGPSRRSGPRGGWAMSGCTGPG